jgi:hypothetical protein
MYADWQVAEILRLQEVAGKVKAVDIVYALPPNKNKDKKNAPAAKVASKLAKATREKVVKKRIAQQKRKAKATGVQS